MGLLEVNHIYGMPNSLFDIIGLIISIGAVDGRFFLFVFTSERVRIFTALRTVYLNHSALTILFLQLVVLFY